MGPRKLKISYLIILTGTVDDCYTIISTAGTDVTNRLKICLLTGLADSTGYKVNGWGFELCGEVRGKLSRWKLFFLFWDVWNLVVLVEYDDILRVFNTARE